MFPHHCVKMQDRGRQYKGTGCNHRHKCVLVDTAWGLYTGVFTYELRATRRRRRRIPAVHRRDATLTYKRARTHAKQSDTNRYQIILTILKIGMLIKLFYSIRFHNFGPRCTIELYKCSYRNVRLASKGRCSHCHVKQAIIALQDIPISITEQNRFMKP